MQVSTPWGAVNVKLGLAAGAVVNAQPEYEDCAALAKQHGVPLKQVIDAAKAEYHCGRRLEQLQSAAPPAGRKQDKS